MQIESMTILLPAVVTYFFIFIISLYGTKLYPLYSFLELVLKPSTLKKPGTQLQ